MRSPAEQRHESLLYTPFTEGGVYQVADVVDASMPVFQGMRVHDRRPTNVELIREWIKQHFGECGDCYVNPGLCDEHDLGIIGYEDDGTPITDWLDTGGEA